MKSVKITPYLNISLCAELLYKFKGITVLMAALDLGLSCGSVMSPTDASP